MKVKAVELRHLDESTIANIRIWRNQDFVSKMMYMQHFITQEEHARYVDALLGDKNRGLYVFYLDNQPFGVFQYQIHPEGNYVTSGNYLISIEDQQRGYGTIQLYFQNEIIFGHLKCNKSYGEIMSYNKKAITTNKKMGAKVEGILRQQILFGKEYVDVYCLGLLADEWIERKKRIEPIIFEFVENEWEII